MFTSEELLPEQLMAPAIKVFQKQIIVNNNNFSVLNENNQAHSIQFAFMLYLPQLEITRISRLKIDDICLLVVIFYSHLVFENKNKLEKLDPGNIIRISLGISSQVYL